ncbi:leucine rich repeat-containing protein [Cystoisospora suis]|uniref:Leucine rich repeat-containing protein n=1 Tax=Cystoisospora suis TaxID=483139 RepID=A0A2C6L3B0_9APIC|nr:leucine rich repeat-containing protein [Cystoisospora suis]
MASTVSGAALGKSGVLTEEMLWSVSSHELRRIFGVTKEADLPMALFMNLPGRQLISIQPSLLTRAVQLREIRVPWNSFRSLDDLLPCNSRGGTPAFFPSLTVLDVSFNDIKEITSFVFAPALQTLDVSFNCLEAVDSLVAIGRLAPNITTLLTKGNPLELSEFSPSAILNALPCVAELNGEAVSHLRGSSPRRPSKVSCVELTNQGLDSVPSLGSLPNLRKVDLSHNKIKSLEALADCTKLETVIATDNHLVNLGDVYGLRELRHLELGQNMIQSFPEAFAHPKKLTFLALENNLITTVGNVVGFDSLTQLFLSYNKLSDFRSIIQLGNLAGLKVLDLAGNSLCDLTDYRDYTLYLLGTLKILDGTAVNMKEQVQLREAFSGKLTRELLEQLLGTGPPYYAESIDLGDRNLRDLGDTVTAAIFPNVKELRLDKNLIASLTGVIQLPELERLELSYNSIVDCKDLEEYQWDKLTVLHLAGNSISNIEGLGGLPALRELDLSHNKIRRCLPGCLQELKFLERLELERNGLK